MTNVVNLLQYKHQRAQAALASTLLEGRNVFDNKAYARAFEHIRARAYGAHGVGPYAAIDTVLRVREREDSEAKKNPTNDLSRFYHNSFESEMTLKGIKNRLGMEVCNIEWKSGDQHRLETREIPRFIIQESFVTGHRSKVTIDYCLNITSRVIDPLPRKSTLMISTESYAQWFKIPIEKILDIYTDMRANGPVKLIHNRDMLIYLFANSRVVIREEI